MAEHVYNILCTKKDWLEVNQENKDIMEDYVLELKQNLKKPSTIKQYTNDYKIVFAYILKNLNNKSLLQLTKKDFRRMSIYFKEECGHSNARVNRLMSAIRSILDYCEEDDDYDYDINTAGKVKGLPKESIKEIIFLTDKQIIALKDKLVELIDYQKATLLILAYTSTCRKNELFQCTKTSFVNNELLSNEVVGKRGKKFRVPYDALTLELANKYLEVRGQDDIQSMWTTQEKGETTAVAVNSLYNWTKYMSTLLSEIEGVEIDFNVHSIRHSALDNLKTGDHYLCEYLGYKDGVPLEKLQLIAHHTSSSTTQSYLKNRDEEQLLEMYKVK